MSWRSLFQSRTRQSLDDALSLLAERTVELDAERIGRAAAENQASQLRAQLEWTRNLADKLERQYTEAVNGRVQSLDLVNTKLLEAIGPEKPPPSLKNFPTVTKGKQQAVDVARRVNQELDAAIMAHARPKKTEATQ